MKEHFQHQPPGVHFVLQQKPLWCILSYSAETDNICRETDSFPSEWKNIECETDNTDSPMSETVKSLVWIWQPEWNWWVWSETNSNRDGSITVFMNKLTYKFTVGTQCVP